MGFRCLPVLLFFAALGLVFSPCTFARGILEEGSANAVDKSALGNTINNDAEADTPAKRYLVWVQDALNAGRWAEALAALERASDFADELSDISYLLAVARFHEGKSRWGVVNALERARAAQSWWRYTEAHAMLMQAEQLIALRDYTWALILTDRLSATPWTASNAAVLRLRALKGLISKSRDFITSDGSGGHLDEIAAAAPAEFRSRMKEALERQSRDPRPLMIFFAYAKEKMLTELPDPAEPTEDQLTDLELLDIALKRLPFAMAIDSDLVWMAAPFVRDTVEARRIVSAYRTGSLSREQEEDFKPHPASIPVALNLGVIDDELAIAELFEPIPVKANLPGSMLPAAPHVIDCELIESVFKLLRREESRNLFMQKLLAYTGLIVSDDDNDGYIDSFAIYKDGSLGKFSFDITQDGESDFDVVLIDGVPQTAKHNQVGAPEAEDKISVQWERYPAVKRAQIGETVFSFRPTEFKYAPITFAELGGSNTYAGLRYPIISNRGDWISERALVANSWRIQKPSKEFPNAFEIIQMDEGIPKRAVEYLWVDNQEGPCVSVTEFEDGKPLMQWIDVDLDGRLETIRHFRQMKKSVDVLDYEKVVEYVLTDWDGDGIYEYGEQYLEGGAIIILRDVDGSGRRPYAERAESGNE